MVYSATSISYQIIGTAHGKIVRLSLKHVRQPIAYIGDVQIFDFSEIGPLSDENFPKNSDVLVLDDRERVISVNTSSPLAHWSQNYKDLAVKCAQSGWLEVKQ